MLNFADGCQERLCHLYRQRQARLHLLSSHQTPPFTGPVMPRAARTAEAPAASAATTSLACHLSSTGLAHHARAISQPIVPKLPAPPATLGITAACAATTSKGLPPWWTAHALRVTAAVLRTAAPQRAPLVSRHSLGRVALPLAVAAPIQVLVYAAEYNVITHPGTRCKRMDGRKLGLG